MRSRSDTVAPDHTLDRARRLGLCGFGQRVRDRAEEDRLARRVARFIDIDDGAYVWTRGGDGHYWLGRIAGPYFYDTGDEAAAVDLVHVRPCRWLPEPLLDPEVPAAVLATFDRGGRNFQQIHHRTVGPDTERLWQDRTAE